jgi:glycine/D-amino acid oxidase-like deaminating enzyme
VVLVSACSGHGFKHAAAVGEIAAELSIGTTEGRLRPDAFRLARLASSPVLPRE